MTPTGGGPELLEAGPAPPSRRARRWRVLALALVVVLVAALGVGWFRSRDQGAAAGGSVPSPSPSLGPTPGPVSSTRQPAATAPVVLRRSGPRLPGFTGGDLFVRSTDTVYRIGLADGRVTATTAGVGGSGPVSFVAGPSEVVLRPLDHVPGLLVPDDRPATELQGLLRGSGRALPAGRDRLWAGEWFDGEYSRLSLVDFDGQPDGSQVLERGTFSADGAGGLLLLDASGVQELDHGRWRLLTRGRVLAAGPEDYLLADCGEARPCTISRYDRRTRTSARVPLERAQLFDGGGLISPDGRYVVALTHDPDGAAVSDVIDLSSGRLVTSFAERDAAADISTVAAWSATGHRLAALDDGLLVVLDPATGKRGTADLDLPPLLGLTLRTAPATR